MTAPLLTVEALRAGYGPSEVLFDVSLAVREGEVVALMGRNGQGKTTTIRAIMGLNRPRGGRVSFAGVEVTGSAPERVARLGIGLVPEGRQVFPTLTVRENLEATAANRLGRAQPWDFARVTALFPRLAERQRQRAATLSGGEQQMLAIGRALMTNPRLLILDEATEGLAPVIRDEIWACLAGLKQAGQSILVVDKNLAALQRLADHAVVLERGRTVWAGDRAALASDIARVKGLVGL
jgi:branched-chain amino acid transport system ATP-binding protein